MAEEERTRDPESAETLEFADREGRTPDAGNGLETETEGNERDDEILRLKDKLMRSYADIENIKKRAAKDKADWFKYANEEVLKEFLSVLDSLRRAKSQGEGAPELSKWLEGVSLIIKQFEDILSRFGVKPIEAEGKTFDPSVHQALAQVDSELEPGTVVEEIQKGYVLYDRVLRPAQVTVARRADSGAASG